MSSYCIMARRTRRRTQKRSRRRRGKSARKRRSRRRQRGGASCTNSEPAPVEVEPVMEGGEEAPEAPAQEGGRRRRKTAKKGKKGKKRKMNEFFQTMIKAKRAGAASFKYKGKTYKGRKHARLGMIYKKA